MEPEQPLSSDCCGNGCSPCVFDLYEQQFRLWQKNGLASSQQGLRTDLLSETCFKSFRLVQKHQIAESVYLFRFQAVQIDSCIGCATKEVTGILPYNVGQHLFLRCYIKENGITHFNSVEGKMVTRAYTPTTISTKEKDCCFEFFAKLYENGVASELLKESSIGDVMCWRGPNGSFNYKPNSFNYILMICMGSGLAPMISILNTIFDNEEDESLVHLMYGVKNMNCVIFRDELVKMTLYWNFTLKYYFSLPINSDHLLKFGEHCHIKKIDNTAITDYLCGKDVTKTFFVICGSNSFTSDIKTYLIDLGINFERNVHIF